MKKTFLIIFTSSILANLFAEDQTLISIPGNDISASYFEYSYQKNNAIIEKKQSREEYLPLFIDFQLKVAEAKAQKLDTVSSFIKDVKNFRKPIANSYITDTAAISSLLKKEYDRMKRDINVSHILIPIETPQSAADTLKAYHKATTAMARLHAGEPFDTVATWFSEDPEIKINYGNIGFISALRTHFSFENIVYETPVGEISQPIRSKFGYHIIKVNSERTFRGYRLVAHIFRHTNDTTPQDNKIAKAKIEEAYTRIQKGEPFESIVKEYSEDPSKNEEGKLPWIGKITSPRMIPSFEDKVYSLQEIGEISAPFHSEFGWHIVKLLNKAELEPFDTIKPILNQFIRTQDKFDYLKQNYVQKLQKEYNFKVNSNTKNELEKLSLKTNSDTVFYATAEKINKPIFTYGDQTVYTPELIQFMTLKNLKSINLYTAIDALAAEKIITYENTQLENKYPEFKNLMLEYIYGSLFFNISKKEIWDKAQTDTIGLKKTFQSNPQKYKWTKPKFRGRVIFCKNKKIEARVLDILSEGDDIDTKLRKLNDDYKTIVVRSEKGTFEEGKNKYVDALHFKGSKIKAPNDFKIVFLDGEETLIPESYIEVRGQVMQDYQQKLEEDWIKTLRAKYPVTVNSEVLHSLKNKK